MAKSKLLETMQAAGLREPDEDGVTSGGYDAHINDNLDPAAEAVGAGPAQAVTAPVQPAGAPSLAADLGRTASDRLASIQQRQAELNAPPTTKQRIFGALAAALPTVAGALGGGIYGASGAAQGTAGAVEEALQRKAQQNQILNQQAEAERGRQEKAADLAAQLEEKQKESVLRQKEIEEQIGGRADVQKLRGDLGLQIQSLKNDIQKGNQDINLRKQGLKRDPDTGKPVPITDEEKTDKEKYAEQIQQSAAALKDAQTEHAQAQAALEKARNDPNSPAFRQAQERLNTAGQRLALSQQQFEMRAFGTNNGQALPGAMLTTEGTPVGSAFQQNVRPTGQERNKADLANSAHDQIQDLKDIVSKRQDIFGPLAGRKTDFTVWLGSQDPDAQRFRAARTIAGDHLAGVFGGRSEAALTAIDSAIGHFKDNPAAISAGLDQLDKANQRFQQAGTVNTAKGNLKTEVAPKKGDVRKGYVFQGGDPADSKNWKKQ